MTEADVLLEVSEGFAPFFVRFLSFLLGVIGVGDDDGDKNCI